MSAIPAFRADVVTVTSVNRRSGLGERNPEAGRRNTRVER
jgi:hypothetical protein